MTFPMINIATTVTTVIATGALAICPLCGNAPAPQAAVAQLARVTAPVALPTALPTESVVTLRIAGMTCGGCVVGVRKVLSRLDGVRRADVSYEKASAVVHFDPSKVTPTQMIAAVKTLGYTAVVAK